MYDFHFDESQKVWVPWMQLVPEYIHNPEVKFLDILGEYKIKYSDDVLLIGNVPPLSAWQLNMRHPFSVLRVICSASLSVMAQISFFKVLFKVV